MSTQSIYLKTRERLADDLDRDLTHQAKDFLLKKRFMLGNGINRKKRNHALMILDFICTENCDLIAHINAELKGCQIEQEDVVDYIMYAEQNMTTKTYGTKQSDHVHQQASCDIDGDCISWSNKAW